MKAHCKPGPKSPTRCNSATSAAIPPTFVPYDSAVAFHKALSPRELANPTFRIAIGELAYALHTKNVEVGVRSIGTLENLCTLSQNEPAVSYLRELAKSFGRSVPQPALGLPRSSNANGNANANATAGTNGNARKSRHDARNDGDALSEAKEDDSVRFSASVQSKLFDTTASPKSISAGATGPKPESGRRRGGDRTKREPSGSSSGKKSKLSKRSVSRGVAHHTKHLSDRSGDLPSLPLETPRSKNSSPSAVPPVVQLQPHTKNLDKVRRRSKKGASTPKRAEPK